MGVADTSFTLRRLRAGPSPLSRCTFDADARAGGDPAPLLHRDAWPWITAFAGMMVVDPIGDERIRRTLVHHVPAGRAFASGITFPARQSRAGGNLSQTNVCVSMDFALDRKSKDECPWIPACAGMTSEKGQMQDFSHHLGR